MWRLAGFLGIALQAAVDGGVDHEAVPIQVIRRPVRFGDQMGPRLVLGLQQALHLGPQPLPEMGRQPSSWLTRW